MHCLENCISIPLSYVQEIGDACFRDCKALETVELLSLSSSSSSNNDNNGLVLRRIGKGAFMDCASLSKIVIPPSTIEVLEWSTFGGSSALVDVSLPNTLTKIQARAFSGCAALPKITIPSSVVTIEGQSFTQCTSLREISFSNTGLLKTIGEGAFCGCRSLTTIVIPSSVTWIAKESFHMCSSLSQVHLSEGLEKIGEGAFQWCPSLTTMTVPSTVQIIGSGAFALCRSLAQVNIIGGALKEIGREVFSRDDSLIEVSLPDGLTSIGSNAFAGCTSLPRVNLPSTVELLGEGMFINCDSLHHMTFPSAARSTGADAMMGCASLVEVNLPEGLQRIERQAFDGCKLHAISIPQSVNVIGERAFHNCPYLVSIEIHPRMKALIVVHATAFRHCESLANFVIPKSIAGIMVAVRNISFDMFFQGCTFLNDQFDSADESSDTINALESRFAENPLHRLSYHASSTTLEEMTNAANNMVLKMQNSATTDSRNRYLVDIFGMTPFHVLLSAAKRRPDLLQVLLDSKLPPNALGWRDVAGKLAVEYLTSNFTKEAKHMMQMCLQKWMVDWISNWGCDKWQTDMMDRVDSILQADNRGRRDTLLKESSDVLMQYAKVEATSQLELWLWKMEMKSSSSSAPVGGGIATKRVAVDRSACRTRCGAVFIIPRVLEYYLLGSYL